MPRYDWVMNRNRFIVLILLVILVVFAAKKVKEV